MRSEREDITWLNSKENNTAIDGHPITVILNLDEMERAAIVGVKRQIEALRRKYKPHFGTPEEGWYNNRIGAYGELGVAKYCGVEWQETIGMIDQTDVLGHQVRTSRLEYEHNNHMNFTANRDKYRPTTTFIMALTGPGMENGEHVQIVKIYGWCYIWDFVTDEYHRQGFGGLSYKIPRSKLLSMEYIGR